MNNILIDGEEFININHTHKILKEKFDLPDYYGENLDAFWDCLTGWIEGPICVKWINYVASCCYLGEYAEKLKNIFEDAVSELEDFSFELIL